MILLRTHTRRKTLQSALQVLQDDETRPKTRLESRLARAETLARGRASGSFRTNVLCRVAYRATAETGDTRDGGQIATATEDSKKLCSLRWAVELVPRLVRAIAWRGVVRHVVRAPNLYDIARPKLVHVATARFEVALAGRPK
jgi:hypothetical protein